MEEQWVGINSLMVAAFNGTVTVVKALLAGGVDPNRADKDGETALIKAAARGHAEVMKPDPEGGAES